MVADASPFEIFDSAAFDNDFHARNFLQDSLKIKSQFFLLRILAAGLSLANSREELEEKAHSRIAEYLPLRLRRKSRLKFCKNNAMLFHAKT